MKMFTSILATFCLAGLLHASPMSPLCSNPSDSIERCGESSNNQNILVVVTGGGTGGEDLDMDALCGHVDSLEMCLRTEIDNCGDSEGMIRFIVNSLQYVCSVKGRAVVVAAHASPCISSPSFEVKLRMERCSEPFMEEIPRAMMQYDNLNEAVSICAPLSTAMKCVTNVASETCGEAVGTLTEELIDIAMETIVPGHVPCGGKLTVARRLATRALAHIKSLLK